MFVTLKRHGVLRGCVGHIEADGPLVSVTGRMAVAAACEDPRFAPVAARELEDLEVELSVLEIPAPAAAEALVPGRHGVIISRGRSRGVLLPQVATEFGWGRVQLLEAACHKAGLSGSAWRQPGTTIELFAVQVIAPPDRS